jgi:predicted metal-dependent phosphotriesterase family hydrolase
MNLSLKVPLLVSVLTSCRTTRNPESGEYIYTVKGKISIEQLDVALTHEHIMSNFGVEPAYTPNYDKVSLYNQVIPYLRKVKAVGVSTI